MHQLPLVTGREQLPTDLQKSSVQKALDDRLTFSEATLLAAALLDQFPNAKNSPDGFIGGIAQVLATYPRSVVSGVTNPVHGIPSDHEFLSVAALVAWCEKKTEPMRAEGDYEIRVKKQLKERADWEAKARAMRPPEGLITYGKHLELAAKKVTKERPIGASEKGGYLGGREQ